MQETNTSNGHPDVDFLAKPSGGWNFLPLRLALTLIPPLLAAGADSGLNLDQSPIHDAKIIATAICDGE
jgi:hypothetical protein